jgi:hypothetical protein
MTCIEMTVVVVSARNLSYLAQSTKAQSSYRQLLRKTERHYRSVRGLAGPVGTAEFGGTSAGGG